MVRLTCASSDAGAFEAPSLEMLAGSQQTPGRPHAYTSAANSSTQALYVKSDTSPFCDHDCRKACAESLNVIMSASYRKEAD